MAGLAAGLAAAVAAVAAVAIAGQTADASVSLQAAPQAGPGHWSQVTADTTSIADVGLVRGSDGVLHILWENGAINGREAIVDTPVAADGAVGKATTIISGQGFASSPDATATPSGLDVFWTGASTLPGPEAIFQATRPVRGGHWSLGPRIAETLLSGSVTAATGSDNRPWVAYTNTFHLILLHLGQRQDDVSTACCVYQPGIAADGASGASYVAYMSLINKEEGIWVHRLSKTGITGSASRLPGSETGGNTLPLNQRVAITGRGPGRAGVYVSYGVGYPAARDLDVYRIGASKPVTLATFAVLGEALAGSTITAGPNGRLWDAWIDGEGTTPELFVRTSDVNGVTWGKTVRVALPSGTQNIWKVYASAQASRVDLVVLLTRDGHTAYYATQSLLA